MNHTVKFLKGSNFSASLLLHGFDSAYGCLCCRNCRHVRYFLLDCRFSQVAVIPDPVFSDRGIHDQIDLSVCDQIQHVRSSFLQLVDHLRLDSVFAKKFAGVSGSDDLEAGFCKFTCQIDNFRFVGFEKMCEALCKKEI